MVRKDKFNDPVSGRQNIGRMGLNDHSLGSRHAAGGLEFRVFLDLHQAHPAIGIGIELGVVAEMGDFDPYFFCRLDEIGPLGNLDCLPIDRERDHFFVLTVVRHLQGIPIVSSLGECLTGHFFSRMWYSNSCRKYLSPPRIGATSASPKAQPVFPAIFPQSWVRRSRSSIFPSPCSIRWTIL